ncbi:hypothetical protein SDC9_141884 [bioreactor metagenome]|uniref:Uncharacterized protein n=1 Tax=bioreactor metagenome TaxID=1076179 RepID=A0A645DZH8_9ZZZZ
MIFVRMCRDHIIYVVYTVLFQNRNYGVSVVFITAVNQHHTLTAFDKNGIGLPDINKCYAEYFLISTRR